MSNNGEMNLLIDVLNTQTEAESGGVKYIFMDENTIYRFENNRMKKVSAALIKKARRLQQSSEREELSSKSAGKKSGKIKKSDKRFNDEDDDEDNNNEEEDDDEYKPRKKSIKKKQQRNNIIDEDEDDEDNNNINIMKMVKTGRRKDKLSSLKQPISDVDLNEYWQVKNKLEYQNLELERYKNKVSKLKQYKNIVSRLTGGEYDQPVNIDFEQQQQQQTPNQQLIQTDEYNRKMRNDGLFIFN